MEGEEEKSGFSERYSPVILLTLGTEGGTVNLSDSGIMIDVTCAILVEGKTILVTQRGPGMSLPGKWEFPGGKVESGEDPESCLRREIREELAVEIRVLERMGDQVWQYPEFTIRLIPFVCSILGGELKLAEHQASLWLGKEELLQLDWAPADVPVLDAFLRQAGW